MWVKAHGGIAGNEEADTKAKMEVWMGERMCRPDIVTLAGILQAFHTSETARALEVGKDRGVGPHIPSDRQGPTEAMDERDREDGRSHMRIRRVDPHNAAHLFWCPWIGDGMGRSWEQAQEDKEWCTAGARFIC